MWWPGQARRQAVKDAARRRADMLAELEARRQAERELADRDTDRPDRRPVFRTVVRVVFPARHVLAPFAVLAGLVLLAWFGTLPDVPPTAPLVLAVAAGAVWWQARLRDRLGRAQERRYAAVCAASALAWLILAQALGPAVLDGWLIPGWAVLSLPWWAHHWPRPRIEAPPTVEGDTIPELWDRYVADPGGPLPGTTLSHPGVTAHSQTWWVQLRRGRQDISTARAALAKIATGLDRPMHRLLFDPVPRDEMPVERPSVVRLQLVVNSPIEATVHFDEPRWRDGRILLGPHADGDGEATWRLYTDNSMWSGYLLGSTGSGKSRQIEGIVLTARAMPVKPITIYLDGQAGASSPTLWEHATWRGGPDQSLAVLAALERGLRARQDWNVVHKLAGFTPGLSPDGSAPLTPVLIVIDECHKILRLAPERWSDLAREQRKCGYGIVAGSQETTLGAFGGSDALRSSLITGNGIAMRTTSRMQSGLFPGLGGDDGLNPVDFPILPGYGYKIAPAGSGERTTAYRGRYLPDSQDAENAETAGVPLPVPTVEQWFGDTPDGVLDDMTARAFGPVFLDRHRIAAESTRAAWDRINGVTPVSAEPVQRVDTTKPARTADVVVEVLTGHGPMSRSDLDAEVARRCGTGPSAVEKALRGLLEDGAVERTRRGVWQVAGSVALGDGVNLLSPPAQFKARVVEPEIN